MLPTCPSCGQSVLDDEAADCPFCGASMSGKPSKSKPAPAKAAPKTPTEKTKPKPKPDEDNPFESVPARTKTAIQAAPKPMKGRLLKVVCPMCDTAGFIPKKAAGRDIRCANKKCMVPVFKAPKPKREPVVTEPEKTTSAMPLILGGLIALGVIGGVLFFLFGNNGGTTPDPVPPPTTNNVPPDPGPETVAPDTRNSAPEDPPQISLAQLREQALESISDAAGKPNDDKPFCRRMTSEGLIAVDRFEKAEQEIELIAGPGESRFYQRVFPLVSLTWSYLGSGQTAKATAALAKAEQAAGTLPQTGRAEFEARAELAAALAAVGRTDDAVKVLNNSRDLSDEVDRESALAAARSVVSMAEIESGTNLPQLTGIADPVSPVWTATVQLLCLRGKGDVAADLASRATDSEPILADTLAAAGSFAAALKQTSAISKIAQVAGAATPVIQARTHAAIAYGAGRVGDQTAAANALRQAESVLASVPQPGPVSIDGVEAMYRFQPPKPVGSVLAAKSLAEVARAQAELGKDSEAKATLQTAISHTHSFCPSPKFMTQRVNEGMTARRLGGILSLADSEARSAVLKFNAKVRTLAKTAAERTDLQADILERLAASKLGSTAWELAEPNGDFSKAERLEESGLPWRVVTAYWSSGKDKDAAAMVKKLKQASDVVLDAEIKGLLFPEQATELGNALSPRDENNPARLKSLYRFAKRHADTDLVKAMEFARGVHNVNWRREILNLIATQAAAKGQGRELVEFAEQPGFEPPDRTAIYRGFLAGVKLDPKFQASAQ